MPEIIQRKIVVQSVPEDEMPDLVFAVMCGHYVQNRDWSARHDPAFLIKILTGQDYGIELKVSDDKKDEAWLELIGKAIANLKKRKLIQDTIIEVGKKLFYGFEWTEAGRQYAKERGWI